MRTHVSREGSEKGGWSYLRRNFCSIFRRKGRISLCSSLLHGEGTYVICIQHMNIVPLERRYVLFNSAALVPLACIAFSLFYLRCEARVSLYPVLSTMLLLGKCWKLAQGNPQVNCQASQSYESCMNSWLCIYHRILMYAYERNVTWENARIVCNNHNRRS